MKSFWQFLWQAPHSDDAIEQIIGLFLHRVLVSLLAAALLIGIVFIFVDTKSINGIPLTLIVFSASLIAFIILKKGHIRIAAYMLVFGIWVTFAINTLTHLGVFSPSYTMLSLVIVFSGISIGNRTVIVVTIANILLGLIAIWQGIGKQFAGVEGMVLSPVGRWVFISCGFIIFAVIVIQMRRILVNMLYQMQRDKEFYLAIVNDQTDYIVRWKPDGVRTFVNEAYCNYYGITPDQAIGTSFFPQIHPDDLARIRAKIAGLSPTNPIELAENQVTLPDGSFGWHRWSDRVLYDNDGGLIGYQSVGRDISSDKELEAKERELAVAQERESFLRDFLSTISHDLQTPLTVMKTSLYIIRKLNDPVKLTEYADRIDYQIGILSRMISDILTVARLENLPSLNLTPIALQSILDDTVTPLRDEANTKQITLNLKSSLGDTEVQADKTELERAFTNLVHNAIKYTPKGGSVSIDAQCENNQVTIQIADTGIGISEEELPNIFDRFFRASNAQGFEKGTGLGLAITQRIIELHEGTIQAKSQIGNGTTFTVNLPKHS